MNSETGNRRILVHTFGINQSINQNYRRFCRTKKACKINTLQAFISLSDHGGVRTPNPQSRNLIFYPVELRGQFIYDFRVQIQFKI